VDEIFVKPRPVEWAGVGLAVGAMHEVEVIITLEIWFNLGNWRPAWIRASRMASRLARSSRQASRRVRSSLRVAASSAPQSASGSEGISSSFDPLAFTQSAIGYTAPGRIVVASR